VLDLLRANISAHLIYFRRSRLLLAFALVFLGLMVLFTLPQMLLATNVTAFDIICRALDQVETYLVIFSATLGLFLVSSHLRARNLKMVFTKPCPPALWLASAFLASILVSLFLQLLITAVAMTACLALGLRVEMGVLFVALDSFAMCVGMIAYLAMLSTALHPVLAVVFVIFLNPSTFYQLRMQMLGFIQSGSKNVLVHSLEPFFQFLYMVLPIFHAFSEKTQSVYSTLRVDHGQWARAFGAFGYDLALAAVCYCLSLFFLLRKRLI
jgi:ABC-type transport system involved in multi-copper enzyme maturation permease subunit